MRPRPPLARSGLALAGKLYPEEPARPHPNCKCQIESRELTARQAQALQGDLALQAQALSARRERIEREKQAAKAKAPAYVDDSRWSHDGDPVAASGKAADGKPVRRNPFPEPTPGT